MRIIINRMQSCIAGGNRRQDGCFIRLNTVFIEVAGLTWPIKMQASIQQVRGCELA
jgi:hypothetical protein